jgi:hypothetical protein
MFSQILSRQVQTQQPPGTVIVLPQKKQNFFKRVIKYVPKKIKSLHPLHWFDGFMDGVKIDLEEFE